MTYEYFFKEESKYIYLNKNILKHSKIKNGFDFFHCHVLVSVCVRISGVCVCVCVL